MWQVTFALIKVKTDCIRPLVAGSIGPCGNSVPFASLEYTGDYEKNGFTQEYIRDYHVERIEALCAADPPPACIAAETIPSLMETRALVEAAEKTGKDMWIAWSLTDEGKVGTEGKHLEIYSKILK